MAKDYWIDHDDPPFPTIRHRSHPKFDPDFCKLISLTEARREIKEKCRDERQHWLRVMNTQIHQTAENLIKEARDATVSTD